MARRLIRRFWARRRLRWATLGLVGFLALSITGAEITSQSWFCNSCHIMNTYYASWKAGTHSDVHCVSCHIPPGTQNFVRAKLNGLGQVVDDVLERTSTLPSASVSDFSCTRAGCHTTDPEHRSGPLTVFGGRYASQYKFKFDHAKHLNVERFGVVMHCTTCHLHARGTKHFEVDTNLCVTCHLAYAPRWQPVVSTALPAAEGPASQPIDWLPPATQAASGPADSQPGEWAPTTRAMSAARPAGEKLPPNACQTCHEPPQKPVMYRGLKVEHRQFLAYKAPCESCHRGVTAKPAAVESLQCFACHDFGIEKMTDVAATHRIHSQGRHKVECFSCHGLVSHGPTAQAMKLDQIDCQACHRNEHGIEQKIYKFSEVPAHVAPEEAVVQPMFLAHVDCTACHIQLKAERNNPASGAMVLTATPKACGNCHEPQLFEIQFRQWQRDTHKLYDKAAMLYDSAVKRPLPADPKLAASVDGLVKEAHRLLETVRLDGSWGVHNPKYIEKLVQDARDRLEEAEGLVGPPTATTRPASSQPGGGGP